MDLSQRLEISFYKTIATINEEHKVYLVQHQKSGKICIKKLLCIYNPEVYQYLYNNHITGTPRLIAVDEEDNQLTIIEEYISGTNLADKIASSDISSEDILKYLIDLCSILSKLHSITPAILHRDIKPSNIIITEYNHAVLLDFNAAKYYSESKNQDTVLLGTKGYAAPEQYGFGSSSPQTDIYSIGIILSEMVSAANISNPFFERIIAKCTMLDPTQRYRSVTELMDELTCNTDSPKPKSSTSYLQKFALPGYRSNTPWKMLTATMFYILLVVCCILIKAPDPAKETNLLLAKNFVFFAALSIIFSFFNYMNLQRFCPLCNSKKLPVKLLGIFILNISLILLLLLILFAVFTILIPLNTANSSV